jgi:hypothetical protein
VAVAVWPSAELAGNSRSLAEYAAPLLERFDPADRVRVVLPAALGGAGPPVSPAEAARTLAEIEPLPAPAAELTVPAADDVAHVYQLAPATITLTEGPDRTCIYLPARPAAVTLDAFAAEPGGDAAEVFVALRNHTDRRQRGRLELRTEVAPAITEPYDLAPGQRRGFSLQVTTSKWFVADSGDGGLGARAFLAAVPAQAATVAILGPDAPLIRRFIEVHPSLALVADAQAADALVCLRRPPPPSRPALVIDPPEAPGGLIESKPLSNISLRDSDAAADHPLLAHLDLGAVAIRRASPWRPDRDPLQEPPTPLVRLGDDVLLAAGTEPRRLWLAFHPGSDSPGFAVSEQWVIFLANAFDYLLPAADQRRYVSTSPPAAPGGIEPVTGPGGPSGPLPLPGLYRDSAGQVVAVSLTGLRSAGPVRDPAVAARSAPLPGPGALARPFELWPLLAAAAAGLWLAGWALRLR